MAIRKEHTEFHKIDLDRGWETLPGYPAGIRQQVLAGFLDEKNGRGFRTGQPESEGGGRASHGHRPQGPQTHRLEEVPPVGPVRTLVHRALLRGAPERLVVRHGSGFVRVTLVPGSSSAPRSHGVRFRVTTRCCGSYWLS